MATLLCPFPKTPLAEATLCGSHEGVASTPGLGGWEKENEMLAKRDRAVWVETIVTTGEHEGTVAAHERFGLDMKVT